MSDHGAVVAIEESDGTALQAASVYRHTETVRSLLKHGAKVIVEDRSFGTASKLKRTASAGHTKTAKMLREKGAQPRRRRCTG